jgi:hypothetical protein
VVFKIKIAEPERALLDWVFLNRQEGLPTPLVDREGLSYRQIAFDERPVAACLRQISAVLVGYEKAHSQRGVDCSSL